MLIILGIIAGLVAFAIGGLWYGLIFRDAWIKASGISMEQIEASRAEGNKGQKEMMLSAIIEVIFAVLLMIYIQTLGVSPLHAAGGMGIFAIISSIKNYLFEQRPIQLILINETYKLVCYLVVGVFALFL
ncbi:DUF1761 domain-containing protein [Streptococcus suis]|nr:DUF1761 domain-containing protein [Streptococcus suis]